MSEPTISRKQAREFAIQLLERINDAPVSPETVVASAQVWATLALSLPEDVA
jgi:hypothetical protein